MKKIYSIAMIAACAMMVFSCKNAGKGGDDVEDAAENAIEAVENAAEKGADAVENAIDTIEDAAENVIDRADNALEKMDGVVPYTSVEVKPTFKGGDADSFVKYVQENIKYPQSALENNESGKVTVSFVVDANGKVRNAQVVKGVSEALDAEALRVVKESPDWAPAKQDGKNVPVTYAIPVTFAIK